MATGVRAHWFDFNSAEKRQPPSIRHVAGYRPLYFALRALRRGGISLPELRLPGDKNSPAFSQRVWRKRVDALARREFDLFSHQWHRVLRKQAGRETEEMQPLLDWSLRTAERKSSDPASSFPEDSMVQTIKEWWRDFEVDAYDLDDQATAPLLTAEEENDLAQEVADSTTLAWLTVHWLPFDSQGIVALPPHALLVVGADSTWRPDVNSMVAAWKSRSAS